MNWLTDIVRPKIKKTTPKEISDDLWVKCPECGQMLFSKELKQSMYVCTKCGHHLRLYVDKRLKQLFDDGIYTEMVLPAVKEDPLKFKDTQRYTDRLKVYRKKTGSNDAIKVGTGKVAGIDTVVAAMDFSFMGGSMGTAVGEGIVTAAEYAEGRTEVARAFYGKYPLDDGYSPVLEQVKHQIFAGDVGYEHGKKYGDFDKYLFYGFSHISS